MKRQEFLQKQINELELELKAWREALRSNTDEASTLTLEDTHNRLLSVSGNLQLMINELVNRRDFYARALTPLLNPLFQQFDTALKVSKGLVEGYLIAKQEEAWRFSKVSDELQAAKKNYQEALSAENVIGRIKKTLGV